MPNIWFTADTHFKHARANMLMHRPFSSIEEMDETMIARWNERVSKKDTIYHLGDFAFTDHDPYLARLNGIKHLEPGNHDHSNRVKRATGWASIGGGLQEVTVNGVHIVLCHYALRTWNRAHYGALHLYGHSHGNLPGDNLSLDVGVDCWNFYPTSLEEIQLKLRSSPHHKWVDHHKPKEI
jgi:calcineurin-like phosphoesterase family protein